MFNANASLVGQYRSGLTLKAALQQISSLFLSLSDRVTLVISHKPLLLNLSRLSLNRYSKQLIYQTKITLNFTVLGYATHILNV